MQNLPRIYLNENLESGKVFRLSEEQGHYLSRVMRINKSTDNRAQSTKFLVFNNGKEFEATLVEKKEGKKTVLCALLSVLSERADPSGRIVLAFAPIKQPRAEEMIAMATQLGVAQFIPVITERTTAPRLNWERLKKIAIEASEQSGRNSVPKFSEPIGFEKFMKEWNVESGMWNLIFADERFAHGKSMDNNSTFHFSHSTLLIGPEGGFSPSEFDALDAAGAIGISLGPTILRAEVAAVAAITKITDNRAQSTDNASARPTN